MSIRATNGVVEVAGLRLRGNISEVDVGHPKRNPMANADGSADHVEEPNFGKVVVEVSYVTDVELDAFPDIIEQPLLVTYASGRKLQFPSMSHESTGTVSKEGTVTVTFSGSRAQAA